MQTQEPPSENHINSAASAPLPCRRPRCRPAASVSLRQTGEGSVSSDCEPLDFPSGQRDEKLPIYSSEEYWVEPHCQSVDHSVQAPKLSTYSHVSPWPPQRACVLLHTLRPLESLALPTDCHREPSSPYYSGPRAPPVGSCPSGDRGGNVRSYREESWSAYNICGVHALC